MSQETPPSGLPSLVPSQSPTPQDLVEAIQTRTPARILVGRAGLSYRTRIQLELRQDHAVALDAVHAELEFRRDFGQDFVDHWKLFEARTRVGNKAEYLMRPDLGRRLDDESRKRIRERGFPCADLQLVIGDGLSSAAVLAQVPALVPMLEQGAHQRGWRVGQLFVVRYCRVGILNEIGELLDPGVVVLLIGERPGLATPESLSAYMAYRPRPGHTDAQRNLISNIHARGVPPDVAAKRILALAEKMRQLNGSGTLVKEDFLP